MSADSTTRAGSDKGSRYGTACRRAARPAHTSRWRSTSACDVTPGPRGRYRSAREQHSPPTRWPTRPTVALSPTASDPAPARPDAGQPADAPEPGRLTRLRRWTCTPGAFDIAVCLVYVGVAFGSPAGCGPTRHPRHRRQRERPGADRVVPGPRRAGLEGRLLARHRPAQLARRREPDEQRLAHPARRAHGAGDRAVRRGGVVRAAGRAEPGRDRGRLVPAVRPGARGCTGARRSSAGLFAGFAPA